MSDQRLCVMCRNFYDEPHYAYSTMTEGGGMFRCRAEVADAPINYLEHSSDVSAFRKAIRFAATCPKYDDAE